MNDAEKLAYEIVLRRRDVLIVCTYPETAIVSTETMDEHGDFYEDEGERKQIFPSTRMVIKPRTGIRVWRATTLGELLICNTSVKDLLIMNQSQGGEGNWDLKSGGFTFMPSRMTEVFIEEHPFCLPV